MKAELVHKDRFDVSENGFVEMVVWKVEVPLAGSSHYYKYRFAYIFDDVCVLRYDNEAGKGDHKHYGKREFDYHFVGLKELKIDFISDVKRLIK